MNPSTRNVSSQYGAPIGRGGTDPAILLGKLHLQRVRLNSGGYDPGGAYWGIGAPLWCAWSEEDAAYHEAYVRAASRDAAKKLFPQARFFR